MKFMKRCVSSRSTQRRPLQLDLARVVDAAYSGSLFNNTRGRTHRCTCRTNVSTRAKEQLRYICPNIYVELKFVLHSVAYRPSGGSRFFIPCFFFHIVCAFVINLLFAHAPFLFLTTKTRIE